MLNHSLIILNKQTKADLLAKELVLGQHEDFKWLLGKKVGLFSISEIERYIEEEELHDVKFLTKTSSQSLKSMSSGERKKALLQYLFEQQIQVLLLVNPYDNLDRASQEQLRQKLLAQSQELSMVQIATRVFDALPFMEKFYQIKGEKLMAYPNKTNLLNDMQPASLEFDQSIPPPLKPINIDLDILIAFKKVDVSFDGKQVLQDINWSIAKGQFWQLIGPNGSGKSTLLNMVTGDSHKGYGQDLTIFGYQKGSGESVWDLKELIGYFSPSMVDRFRGYHTLEQMLISGLHDSIGLYTKPSENERNLAQKWLDLLRLTPKNNRYFHELSIGEKRLVMTARAMIKHAPLLILDEPTSGLDDASAAFFVKLVNQYAEETQSTIIFVSHREEEGLRPKQVFELIPKEHGSIGKIR